MFFSLLKISGHSMEPTLKNGHVILVSTFPYWLKNPQVHDIILFKRNNKKFIKRIISIKGDEYFVKGDNASDSLDSRQFGTIKKNDIQAKVLFQS